MSAPQTQTNPPTADSPYPEYTASERPATKVDRIAFQIWTILFLFVIAATLVVYIANWVF